MQTLRELHKDERRAAILLAARDVVAEGGLEMLTMRSLGERARVSVPTIYNLIGGRPQVLAALMAAGGDQFAELLTDVTAAQPTIRMVRAAEALATVVAPNADVVTAVLADGIGGPTGSDTLFPSYARFAFDTLDAARAAGALERAADPVLLTERCTALASGAVIAWATGHRDHERLRDELVHGAMVVLVAHARGDELERARREMDRRARRLVRARKRTGRVSLAVPVEVAR